MKKTENDDLEKAVAMEELKHESKIKRKAMQQAPAHVRTKSDIGTLHKDANVDPKFASSHRTQGVKFSLLFAQKLSPDESKVNSARNHLLENYGSSGSSNKVKKLLCHRLQTHKRKWNSNIHHKEGLAEELKLSDRRIIHIRRETTQPKRDPLSLAQSGVLFPSGGLNSASNTKLDIHPSSLTQSATNISGKKVASVKMSLVYHLDAVRDVRFMSEHEVISVSEDYTIGVWDLQARRDKLLLPNHVLRSHLTPILSLDKENYDLSVSMFYSGGVDGILKAWRSYETESLKGRSVGYEQFASFRVSTEPIWEISSCPFAVVSLDLACLSDFELRFCEALDLSHWSESETLSLQA